MFFTTTAKGQILSIGTSGLNILNGTTVVADSLTLIPSADITISNNTLNKATTIVNTSSNPYISRVYRFTNNTPAFSGSVQINYLDGAELNSIAESALTLNIHNGTTWTAYNASTRDATNNFVLTNSVNSTGLNELILSGFALLQLTWLTFTVTKQNQTALLKWATAHEQNTQDFILQHSANGKNWTAIGTLQAAGNSSSTRNYSYVHSSPVIGINYYRILQIDLDNQSSYSAIRMLWFTKTDEPFTIFENPVTNNILTVQINEATSLALYTADGKLLWNENVNAGIKTIDMSRYAKGTYLLKAKNVIQKIVKQ
jgi:hypothetical protein